MELYRKYRPESFEQVIGNEQTKKQLVSILGRKDKPHSYLFVGSAGCGKTTLAFIMANELGITSNNLEVYNSGNFRGIDTIRELEQSMQYAASGKNGVKGYILEEAHKLTADAQEALLKPLEECPEHVYFFLTTTNPEKLNKALKTRMTTAVVEAMSTENIVEMINYVLEKEGVNNFDDAMIERIAEQSNNSARMALVNLERFIGLDPEARSSASFLNEAVESVSIDICRALASSTSWKAIADILASNQEDPEGVRRCVIGYMNAILLKADKPKAAIVLDAFSKNFYDTGKCGLTLAAYNAFLGCNDVG
jgi:DNA polymerase-3 subunit gamma/tau